LFVTLREDVLWLKIGLRTAKVTPYGGKYSQNAIRDTRGIQKIDREFTQGFPVISLDFEWRF